MSKVPAPVDFNDLYPAAPGGFVNVLWQKEDVGGIRKISAYYAAGGGGITYLGTLDPDTRPSLGSGDARQTFYATDKDHLLMWTGTVWTCMNYDAGSIGHFIAAPGGTGWVLANGTGTAKMTNLNGSLTTVSVPDLTTGVYMKGGTTYSGPTATAAVAPGFSGAPVIGGTVTGNLPSHMHDVGTDNIGTGSIFVSLGHSDVSGHLVDPWAPSVTITGVLPSHVHGLSALDSGASMTDSEDAYHGHLVAGLHCVEPNAISQVQSSISSGIYAWTSADANITGVLSSDENATHAHEYRVDFTALSTDGYTSDPIDLSLTTNWDSGYGPVATGWYKHFHVVSGTTDDVSAGPIALTLALAATWSIGTFAINTSGLPKSLTALPYLRL